MPNHEVWIDVNLKKNFKEKKSCRGGYVIVNQKLPIRVIVVLISQQLQMKIVAISTNFYR